MNGLKFLEDIYIKFRAVGAKVQVTGHKSGYRPQVIGQATGQRPHVRLQATGHRSGYRPQIRPQVTKNNRTLDKTVLD